MAKLQLAQVPTSDAIKQTLEQRLPQYKYSLRGKIVVCAKSSAIGAMVVPKKDGVVINGNFPNMGMAMFFTLFMIFTGILLGLILWLALWKGGQDKVRDEVQAVLQQAFGVAKAA